MKTQHFVNMIGNNASKSMEDLLFYSVKPSIQVAVKNGVSAEIITTKGNYQLIKHPTLGIYQGVINGIKVHFTHKAWKAQLIYWS